MPNDASVDAAVEMITFDAVEWAASVIGLPATPAWSYPVLDAVAGVTVVVKHENVQPTGAFKVRGGLTLLAGLTEAEKAGGLVTASTGNHAQSVAFAAARGGVRAVIVAPESSPAGKLDAVRALGAEVVVHGPTMTEALALALRLADEQGLRYVDPGNEPAIVLGHATVYLELFRQRPDLKAVYVPIGSGSGAAGACVVRDALAPDCRVIGVQSAQAPAAHDSWAAGTLLTRPCLTRMSGLATGAGFALPQQVLRARMDDFVLVSDNAIDDARRLLARYAHTLAEGAGAAALAGVLASARSAGPVAVVCTGGNADEVELATMTTAG